MSPLSSQYTDTRDAVQKNCHISDARHAGDFSLCVYLLKMREYYRWENGCTFHEALGQDDVGSWLKEREALWDTLDAEEFSELPINGKWYDPFDNNTINQALQPAGLVYSGGIGRNAKPHFFLGKLQHEESQAGYSILTCSEEYARDISAPPAMTLGQSIYIREECIRRMVWEKVEEWRWNTPENAMGKVIARLDFDNNLEHSLNQMTCWTSEMVLSHEKGEIFAGQQLGSNWEKMLSELPRSRAEIIARSVRDHLADSLTTLPLVLQQSDTVNIHLYMANLSGMRKQLWPSLLKAYQHWMDSGESQSLATCAKSGPSHWFHLAQEMIHCFQHNADDMATHIEQLAETGRL